MLLYGVTVVPCLEKRNINIDNNNNKPISLENILLTTESHRQDVQ